MAPRPTTSESGAEQRCSAPLYVWGDFLSHQLCKQVRVHIAAGENDDDVPALGIDAAGEQRGKPNGAARLDHELQLAIGKGDCSRDLFIRGCDTAGEQLAV